MIRLAPAERLLLTAALADRAEAVRAWEAWRHTNTIDAATWPSARLFTLVGHQLRHAGAPDPDLERLQGAQRFAWANGVAIAREASDASQLLRGLGLPSMVLKGVALQHAYPSPGLRSMGDADLLIPERLVRAALTALAHGGWKLERLTGPRWHSLLITEKGTVATRRGRQLDVHWRPVHDVAAGADAPLWSSAVERTVHGHSLLLPHAAHQVVVVLAHGLRDGSGSALQGLCDAAMLLATGEADPRMSVELARRWQRLASLREGVRLLRQLAPSDAIEQFAEEMRTRSAGRVRPTMQDSLGHIARTIEPGHLSCALARAAQRLDAPSSRPKPDESGGSATHTDNAPEPTRLVRVTPGRVIEMGRPGLASRVCLDGWSGVEPWGRWSDGPRASLVFIVRGHPRATHWPVMFFMHCRLGRRGRQRISVRVDGRRTATWKWKGDTTPRGEILLLPVGTPVRVEFRIRHLTPINELDRRLAGIALQWFRAEAQSAPAQAPSRHRRLRRALSGFGARDA